MTNALRPSELFALKWKSFDSEESTMCYVAVAAKMARIAHGIIKSGTDFRCLHAPAFHLVEISF